MKKSKDLNILDYYLFPSPASSLDMNPVGHVWRLMNRRTHHRWCPGPMLKRIDFIPAIKEEWDDITSEEIEELTSLMPERLLAVDGGHTQY
ncbi:hypothetical protein EDC01DRAFT_678807 [Geopyxis carbonaria]|nr:hypothetical protein EDC01DRAFT_678807 [Geopyxis carbonaria]